MRLISIFWFFFFVAIHNISGQAKLPSIITASPQAAQYIRYGEIPVGHTTGIPQINIPIYTLNTGWIDIPISISYHASGFRPNEIPSPVGLGWLLNVGGVISRSIEINPDYEDINSGNSWDTEMPIKSAANVQDLKNGLKLLGSAYFNTYDYWSNWEPFFFTSGTPILDTRTDRYSYNFLDKSGVVRYDVDSKKLTTIPYDPIKIEKNGDIFLITDTKGLKYEFSKTETTFISGKGKYTSSWYLTKITYPGKENEPIIFSYKDGTSYADYYSSYNQTTQIIDARSIPASTTPTNGKPQSGSTSSTSFQTINYSSPLIQTITWKNVTIEFSYSADRLDKRKDRIDSISVKYANEIIKQANFDNNTYLGNTSLKYRLKLKGITVKGSDLSSEGEKYAFNYYNESAIIPDYDMKCNYDYWGYYNGTNSSWTFPNDIDIDKATYNRFVNAPFTHSVSSTDRKPYLETTKTCVLKEIIYPTKGKTYFEYEQNQVSDAYEFMNYNYVGGLRLKQLTNYSSDNTITNFKTYSYEGYSTQKLKNDLFVYYMECIGSFEELYAFNPDRYTTRKIEYPIYYFVGTSLSTLSGWTSSNVFYNKIKEYNGTPNSNNGWTEYNYIEENRALNNNCYWNIDEYPAYMFSKYVDCDKGNIKGLLTNTIFYNKNGNVEKEEEIKYTSFLIPSIHTGVRIFQNATYGSGGGVNPTSNTFQARLDYYNSGNIAGQRQTEYENFFLNRIFASDTYAFRDIYLPQSITEKEYLNGLVATTKTTSFNYDVSDGKPVLLIPTTETVQNSNGEDYVKKTIFPYSTTYKNIAPYNIMVSNNMLNYPLEVKIERGANNRFVKQSLMSYKQIPSTNIIRLNIVSEKYKESNLAEPRISYLNYDSFGNPTYISKDSIENVAYLWSYQGQYPIAEIKNATYSEIEAAVKSVFGSNETVNTLSQRVLPNESKLKDGSLQRALPKAHVTSYTYKPLIGILTITDPSNKTTYYEYDSLGRLTKVKDSNNKIVEEYNYNYSNK